MPPGPRKKSSSAPARLREFLRQDQWALEIGSLPTFRAIGLKLSRVLYIAGRGFVVDRCSARASALTYITILSIVPLLAFAFSVAKGFGAGDVLDQRVIQPFVDRVASGDSDLDLMRFFKDEEEGSVAADTGQAPVPSSGELEVPVGGGEAAAGEPAAGADAGQLIREAADRIMDFVQSTDVKSLGVFGLALLVFTVIKLLGAIEGAFNDIWGIPRSRPFLRKLSDYLSITISVPILLILATGLRSTSLPAVGPLLQLLLDLASFASIWIGFAFLYLFLPNTRVSIGSAIVGGVVGGSLWQVAQALFFYLQIGVVNYNAIYAGFAALPILLLWLHVSWLTVLLGAELAYAFSSEQTFRQMVRDRALDHRARQRIALSTALAAADRFRRGEDPPTERELAEELSVPERAVDGVLQSMSEAGLVALSEHEGGGMLVLPARDLDLVRVEDVLDALRGDGHGLVRDEEHSIERLVLRTFEARDRELAGAAYNCTLRELAERLVEKGGAGLQDLLPEERVLGQGDAGALAPGTS